jgi:hypothetical protein
MTRRILFMTALVAGVATTADAQLCAGNASFSAGRMRAGVGAEFPEGAKNYGGNLTWSHGSGVYLGGTIGRMDDNNGPESAMDYAANLGYELSLDSKFHLCPTGHFGMTKGPDAANEENSITHYGLGGTIGRVLSSSDNMAIVPSLGFNWVHASYKTTTTGGGGGTTEVSDSWMEATIGAGFVINRDVTFAPTIRIPLNQDGAESTFGFSLSYNFGRAGGVTQQGRRRR